MGFISNIYLYLYICAYTHTCICALYTYTEYNQILHSCLCLWILITYLLPAAFSLKSVKISNLLQYRANIKKIFKEIVTFLRLRTLKFFQWCSFLQVAMQKFF